MSLTNSSKLCRLIVDECPIDGYGMKLLAAARKLWMSQGKLVVTNPAELADYSVIQIIGGEPMNYPARVLQLATGLKLLNSRVKIKLYTGFPDVENLLKIAPFVDCISITLSTPEDENHFRVQRLGFRDFGDTRMEVRYNSATGEDPHGRVFEKYWSLIDMAAVGDYLLTSSAKVIKLGNKTLFDGN